MPHLGFCSFLLRVPFLPATNGVTNTNHFEIADSHGDGVVVSPHVLHPPLMPNTISSYSELSGALSLSHHSATSFTCARPMGSIMSLPPDSERFPAYNTDIHFSSYSTLRNALGN